MEKYEYPPFADNESIRILRLNPGQTDEPLTGSIDFVKTSDLAEYTYEPISYTWGSDHARIHSIICDGRALGLSTSLHGALRRLRLPDQPRNLWADQICINQDNYLERSSQIQLMHTIYKSASCVLVWLGEDVDGIAQSAFDLIRDLSDVFQDGDRLAQFREDYGQRHAQQSTHEWRPLQVLTEVSWFERVWIVQEIGTKSPARMFWGAAEIDWIVVHRVCHGLTEFYQFRKLFNIRTSRIKYLYQRFIQPARDTRHENRFSFIYELHRGRHLKASDPRDRVFAMLGHYSIRQGENKEIGNLIPSYQISIEDVYIDVARRALQGDHSSLITLAAVQHVELPGPVMTTTETHEQLHLPSWVPDWRNYQSHILSEPTSPHRASGMVPDIKFHSSYRVLSIRGAIISRVVACSKVLSHGDFREGRSKEAPTILNLWNQICRHDQFDLDQRYVTGESALFAYTQTLSSGCVAIAWHQKRRYSEVANEEWLRHGAAYIVKSSGTSQIVSDRVRAIAPGGNAYEWVRAANGASTNRRFGRTECDRYVLGPAVMRKDDILCVLFGGKMPFILRPVGSSYWLVGECYSHGLMNDEIVGLLQKSKAEQIVFDIF